MRTLTLAVAVALALAITATSAIAAPNVVLIQTDDQSMNTMGVMARTRALIGDQGMTFDRHYVSYSLCCPSRASLLTGQYAHNHGVRGNFPPAGGYGALDHHRTLPVWLQRAGYRTGHVGKYLNFYSLLSGIPPGWDEWYTAVDPFTYRYTEYVLNENGLPHLYGRREQDYQTDVYTRKAVEFIGRNADREEPFFLAVDYMAAHGELALGDHLTPTGPPRPAKRHAGAMASATLPTPPSFNEADVSDKPSHVRDDPSLTAAQIEDITTEYRLRLESLLAVDEGVEKIIDKLAAEGVLEDTIVIFMSDNGWMSGEHRYHRGKLRVYEPSTRVPLLVRGPGVAPGTHSSALTANIDLAPTIAELAGATPDVVVDGRSLTPAFANTSLAWERDLLHEYFPTPGGNLLGEGDDPGFTAVRTQDGLVLAEHDSGEGELYDLTADPFQLNGLQANPEWADERAALSARLAALRTCAGASCN